MQTSTRTATKSSPTPQAELILGIGDIGATKRPGRRLKTIGLGSCVGLILHDPVTGTVGLAHVALPDSSISTKGKTYPKGYFADRAVNELVSAMVRVSGMPFSKRYVAKLIGGANMKGIANVYDIGTKNVSALRGHLHHLGVVPVAEEIGSHISRTVAVEVGTGCVVITTPGQHPRTI